MRQSDPRTVFLMVRFDARRKRGRAMHGKSAMASGIRGRSNGKKMTQQLRAEDLLASRYPELVFLLQITKETDLSEGESLDLQDGQLPSLASLDAVDVLYLYGLGLSLGGKNVYRHFHTWLAARQQRQLVFIEESIATLRAYLQTEDAYEMLAHPRVHLKMLLSSGTLPALARECARAFPAEAIEVLTLSRKGKRHLQRFYKLRTLLLRATTVEHALVVEGLYYHLFCKNLFPNFLRWSFASEGNSLRGQFRNVPAIICGAGPSLAKEVAYIKQLEQQALIIAGGSAITALSQRGAPFHLAVAIDPNFEEYKRFLASSAFEVPLVYVNRVHPQIFATCNGLPVYVHTLVGGSAEMWMEKKLGIDLLPFSSTFDIEAMSVTTTAIELAYAMGCNPIILAGVDLAFTDRKSYAPGVSDQTAFAFKEQKRERRAAEQLLKRKGHRGQSVYTLVKWIMEESAISRFAAKTPATEWINATDGGLGFQNIPYRPLKEITFSQRADVRGRLFAALEERRLGLRKDVLRAGYRSLSASVRCAQGYCVQALQELQMWRKRGGNPETGKLIFLLLELEETAAYEALLKPARLTLERIRARSTQNAQQGEEADEQTYEQLVEMWESLSCVLCSCLDQLSQIEEGKGVFV